MNTQTHVLLACAVLVPGIAAINALRNRPLTDGDTRHSRISNKLVLGLVCASAIMGALAPDASIYVMFIVAKLQGVADSEIWSTWYYSDYWQRLGAITNSIPVYLLLALIGCGFGGQTLIRWMTRRGAQIASVVDVGIDAATVPRRRSMLPGIGLFAFSIAALLHVLTDLPLHHDDGHPHFWPLSNWIFMSPVSYWDPAHYGRIWSVIEVFIAILLIVILWRRFRSKVVYGVLLLTATSYIVVTGYWWLGFS